MNALETTSSASAACHVDHLVVVATDLEQGARWCLDTLGVTPVAGGRHPLMATHNLLLKLGGDGWPDCYLEIIAIDPLAEQPPAAGRKRWFGLDDPLQRERIKQAPRLAHFVARVPDLQRAVFNLAGIGEDVGEIVAASRKTPDGELRWQITVRADGVPQHRGSLPTLIEWHRRHPTTTMANSGVSLLALTARCASPLTLERAWAVIGLDSVRLTADGSEPALGAILQTPLGEIRLRGGAC